MDQIDAPYTPIKQRKKTTFQQELDEKMKQRRKQGLSHDLTSEESDIQGYDSEEENIHTRQYQSLQMSTQRRDRPTSAKRRSDPLGETITPKGSQRFMKKKPESTMPTLGKTSPSIEKSPRFSGQSEVDRMFGSTGSPKSRKSPIEERYNLSRTSPSEDKYGKSRTSPLDDTYGKSRTSPLDDKYGKSRTSPLEDKYGKSRTSPLDDKYGMSRTSPLDDRFGKSRTSPVDSSMSRTSSGSPSLLPKSMGGKSEKSSSDKKSPLTKEMSKEDLIFGRKTPTYDDGYRTQEKKEWKAPNFRKGSPVLEEKPPSPSPLDQGRGGRKTPMDLQTISENPKPAPRFRSDRSPTDQKLKSRESSPRSLSIESPKGERRAKPKADIFGKKKEKEVDFDLEVGEKEKRFSSARARRQSPTSRTSQQSKSAQDRPGRFSKQDSSSLDRRTPTKFDRRTPPVREDSEERGKAKKDVGLFDFLNQDESKTEKEKEKQLKPRLRKDRPVERESSLKKSVSHDSITDELLADGEHPSMYEKSSHDTGRHIDDADRSSLCADLDDDPNRQIQREKERAVRAASAGKQRRDKKEADDIINRVTSAQTDPQQFKERPLSAKTNDKLHKPKPRHSLPGSVTSDQSVDAFNSTTSIRQAIFDEWRKAKEVETKKKLAEQKKLEKEKKEKKEKDERDKKLESMASYNAWMKQRGESFVKEQKIKKKEEDKKQQEKDREQRQQEKHALMNFKRWKEQKDEKLVEQHKKKVEEKHRKLQETRSEKKEKDKDNERAYIKWKERKDKVLVESDKKQKEEMKKTVHMSEKEKRQKEEVAMHQYNEWMRKKEQQQFKETMKKKQTEEEFYEEYKPAWSPASKLIPCGR